MAGNEIDRESQWPKSLRNRGISQLLCERTPQSAARMAEPPAKRKRVHSFQESWRRGRPWLVFNPAKNEMTCSLCQRFAGVGPRRSGGGHDAWMHGCKRLKVEVVAEHERSKCHRDAEVAAKTRAAVVKQGGLFGNQIAKRDDATMVAMKLLFWLLKENVALEKWNSLKGKSKHHHGAG